MNKSKIPPTTNFNLRNEWIECNDNNQNNMHSSQILGHSANDGHGMNYCCCCCCLSFMCMSNRLFLGLDVCDDQPKIETFFVTVVVVIVFHRKCQSEEITWNFNANYLIEVERSLVEFIWYVHTLVYIYTTCIHTHLSLVEFIIYIIIDSTKNKTLIKRKNERENE